MLLGRISLILTGVAYAVVGAAFLAAPAAAGALVGVGVGSTTADNDVRAVYGGLSAGLALFFWLASARPGWLRPALCAQVLTLGGLALGRILSLLLVGQPEPIGYALHAGELVGTAVGLIALRLAPGSPEPA